MSLSFLPKLLASELTELNPQILGEMNVTALFMDFDNTIVPYSSNEPTEKMKQWLMEMKNSGIVLCVVSNSRKPRVEVFCKHYGLGCVTHSNKPFSKGIREALEKNHLDPKTTALVGDQIFTDVLGGNCGGLVSILVKPIALTNIWLKMRHILEKPFIFASKKRKIEVFLKNR